MILVSDGSRRLRRDDGGGNEARGEPCGRVNIVRNQEDVTLNVIEGTRKRTLSHEQSTMSAL
jgi:hypothetical protein